MQTLTKSLADTWILRGFLLTFAKFVLILGVIKVIKIEINFSSQRFFQKTDKRIRLYYYDTSGQRVFVCFLEEIEDTTN